MSTAPKYVPHYTIDDYRLWEGDWELWNGIAVAMTPSPFGRHGNILARSVAELSNAIDRAACHASVIVEVDWVISSDTILRPELSIVCGDAPEGHLQDPPELIVEVLSPSSRERDLEFKRPLYEHHGVKWYLTIDPDNGWIQILHLSPSGRYAEVVPEGVVRVQLCEKCQLDLDLSRFSR